MSIKKKKTASRIIILHYKVLRQVAISFQMLPLPVIIRTLKIKALVRQNLLGILKINYRV